MVDDVNLEKQLKHYFGFDKFKGDQKAIIQNLMGGNDTFVLMPTGGGKSLCYQLPSLLMDGVAIVVSPLIALMKNQVDVINGLSENEGVAHYLNSTLNKATFNHVIDDVRLGVTKLLYVAPESLNKEDNVELFKQMKISFYAIDEAHCISEWGHDFRPEYRNIRPTIAKIGNAPVIALTATATDKVRSDIKKSLGITDAKEFKSSFNRPNLYYEVRQKTKDVDKDIINFIRQNKGKSGIIYCLSRKQVEEFAAILKANDIKAEPYHAGLDSAIRSQTQDDFLMEKIDVIVATIAFGMGIDKPDVRFVIHYDMPKSLEGYYQETGRAGRDGGEGQCVAFYAKKDLDKLEKFMAGKPVAEQDIGKQLLEETKNYAESSMCRRKILLHYFGEDYKKDNCESCDNCLHPKERKEAETALIIVLNAIIAIKENFTTQYVIDFVRGKNTDDILAHKHDNLEEFGSGADEEKAIWAPTIRQALIEGYLRKDVEEYGLLKVTNAGRQYLKNPKSFMVVEDQIFNEEEESDAGSVLDPLLYSMLKDLRKRVATKLGVPPYVVFQDVSLEHMCTMYPIDLQELQNIPGVGAGKATRYGKDFCAFIKQYCQDNDIERPGEQRVKTVAKKSILKVKIIQSIDRKVALDDIANAQGLDFNELLDEMEAIVYSGTKLNIDYFIDDYIDEDHIDDIYDYFTDSDTDKLKVAMSQLGCEYPEEEIRLIRIKFLSEMAN